LAAAHEIDFSSPLAQGRRRIRYRSSPWPLINTLPSAPRNDQRNCWAGVSACPRIAATKTPWSSADATAEGEI
jgi:hypothetical protein